MNGPFMALLDQGREIACRSNVVRIQLWIWDLDPVAAHHRHARAAARRPERTVGSGVSDYWQSSLSFHALTLFRYLILRGYYYNGLDWALK